MADPNPLDLTKKQDEEQASIPVVGKSPAQPSLERADPYSIEWAKIVKPITAALLLLLALVMLLPFWLLASLSPPNDERMKNVLDWAKTVLPSVVGFASAMVGYYFGTRAGPGRTGGNGEASPAAQGPATAKDPAAEG